MSHAGGRRAAVAAALLGALAGPLARRVRRIEVSGASMLPAFEPGDRVVVVRAGRIRPGDAVACADPRDPVRIMVKRVASVTDDARYVVLGDNAAASTDSRHFGPIGIDSIIGRLVYRYFPRDRAGHLPRSARFVWEIGDTHARSVKKL